MRTIMTLNPMLATSSPHVRDPDSTRRIMWTVNLALLPALLAGGYFFGWRAFYVSGLSVLAAMASELLCQKLRKKPMTLGDGSAIITGLLVAFCMPPTVRWFVPVVGSAAAIILAKQVFGGLGNNIWNPALVGRAFVHNAFPVDLNPPAYPLIRTTPGEGVGAWIADFFHRLTIDVGSVVHPVTPEAAPDVISGATPLAVIKDSLIGRPEEFVHAAETIPAKFEIVFQRLGAGTAQPAGLLDAFVGNIGGNIGEISAVLLLAGAALMLARRVITWHIPVTYLASFALLMAILPLPLGGEDSRWIWAPALLGGSAGLNYVLMHLLTGGLMLGALYMATDMVTSPMTVKGLIIFGIGCGLLTALIRLYGAFPEGVSYAILLMNTTVPIIDRFTRPRTFGTRTSKAQKPAEAKA
jgi:Na+-translocating ferredoxin:NAD+ oxidoreductase subunit D